MGRLLSRHLSGYQKPKDKVPESKPAQKRKTKVKKKEGKK